MCYTHTIIKYYIITNVYFENIPYMILFLRRLRRKKKKKELQNYAATTNKHLWLNHAAVATK